MARDGVSWVGGGLVETALACGDDRHDPVPGEFLHEQISKTGLHSLQRRHPGPQFIVESRSSRGAAHRDLNVLCYAGAWGM